MGVRRRVSRGLQPAFVFKLASHSCWEVEAEELCLATGSTFLALELPYL